ncbi:MAG TPA: CoA-transferase, partial [Candidatus Limiplasma sp.]|nr:CoA-transferase [Candidatus Limiplasma sp.]
ANDYFAPVADPFTGETLNAVRALRPDVCIVHAHVADEQGNALIEAPKYDDVLLSRAAKTTIVTAERIVSPEYFAASPVKADIPHFLVSAVVDAPRGAAPSACHGLYGVNREDLLAFLNLADEAALASWLTRRG